MSIIMLCGNPGVGKSTISDYLVNNYNYVEVAFADIIKDITVAIYGWDKTMIKGKDHSSRFAREQYSGEWSNLLGEFITPRKTMQRTADIFKTEYGDDFWAKLVVRKVNQLLNEGKNIVISDLRYTVEFNYVYSMCFVPIVTIRIITNDYSNNDINCEIHSSGNSHKMIPVDAELINNLSIDILYNDFMLLYNEILLKKYGRYQTNKIMHDLQKPM